MDIPAFRAAFPEFADTATYPKEMVKLWSDFAELNVSSCRWKENTVMGVRLLTAHELVLAGKDLETAAIGGTPGQASGPANSKTVGSVSVGYDSQATSEQKAGYFNLTTYGKQYFRLSRMYGAGAIQL